MIINPQILNTLSTIYNNPTSSFSIKSKLNKDIRYFESSIPIIDYLWMANFLMQKSIKLVILGEAPLWGNNGKYIYNPNAGISNFIYGKNLTDFYGGKINNKMELLSLLLQKGILFLDVLPFPLNPNITAICYNNPNNKYRSYEINSYEYNNLIASSSSTNLIPKLQLIKTKLNSKAKWIYRYKNVAKHHNLILNICNNSLVNCPLTAKWISTKHGNIDQKELNKVLP